MDKLTRTTATFDVTASAFDLHRALPSGVPEAIRAAIWNATSKPPRARVLDLGAGTGRFGRAFVESGDRYVGVDLSFPMLAEFAGHSRSAVLTQADGGTLPFPDGVFDLVLLMHVLSSLQNWHNLLGETVRVLKPGGFVAVGHIAGSMAGVDARMRRQLKYILEALGPVLRDAKKAREEPLAWLHSTASGGTQVTAATWTAQRTPREFLDRHRTGARFLSLPAKIQEQSMKELGAWAKKAFGSIDNALEEEFSFVLQIFKIGISP